MMVALEAKWEKMDDEGDDVSSFDW